MAIHLLEQEGIDVKNFDEDGRAALHYAACHDKNSECLDVFLAQSDVTRREVNKWNKVDCCFGGRTPLWMAVSVNAVGCVQLLLNDNRIDPNIKDEGGTGIAPLTHAINMN